jgi:hypothetical protein
MGRPLLLNVALRCCPLPLGRLTRRARHCDLGLGRRDHLGRPSFGCRDRLDRTRFGCRDRLGRPRFGRRCAASFRLKHCLPQRLCPTTADLRCRSGFGVCLLPRHVGGSHGGLGGLAVRGHLPHRLPLSHARRLQFGSRPLHRLSSRGHRAREGTLCGLQLDSEGLETHRKLRTLFAVRLALQYALVLPPSILISPLELKTLASTQVGVLFGGAAVGVRPLGSLERVTLGVARLDELLVGERALALDPREPRLQLRRLALKLRGACSHLLRYTRLDVGSERLMLA